MRQSKRIAVILASVIWLSYSPVGVCAAAVLDESEPPAAVRAVDGAVIDKARAQRYYELGLVGLGKGKFAESAALLGEAVKADPTDLRLYWMRSRAYKMNADRLAAEWGLSAQNLVYDSAQYVLDANRQRQNRAKKKKSKGSDDRHKTSVHEGQQKESRFMRKIASLHAPIIRNYELAVTEAERALAQSVSDAEKASAFWHSGMAYAGLGEYFGFVLQNAAEEENNFRLMTLLEPKKQVQYYRFTMLGEDLARMASARIDETYQKAMHAYDEALRLAPRHASAYAYRGTAYHALGSYRLRAAGAPRGYWAGADVRSELPKGAASVEASDYRRALDDYYKAMDLSANYRSSLMLQVGDTHRDMYEDEQALAWYARALAIPSLREDALQKSAALYYSRGDTAKAAQDLSAFLKIHKDLGFLCSIPSRWIGLETRRNRSAKPQISSR